MRWYRVIVEKPKGEQTYSVLKNGVTLYISTFRPTEHYETIIVLEHLSSFYLVFFDIVNSLKKETLCCQQLTT